MRGFYPPGFFLDLWSADRTLASKNHEAIWRKKQLPRSSYSIILPNCNLFHYIFSVFSCLFSVFFIFCCIDFFISYEIICVFYYSFQFTICCVFIISSILFDGCFLFLCFEFYDPVKLITKRLYKIMRDQKYVLHTKSYM